jgi:hypothetical protein
MNRMKFMKTLEINWSVMVIGISMSLSGCWCCMNPEPPRTLDFIKNFTSDTVKIAARWHEKDSVHSSQLSIPPFDSIQLAPASCQPIGYCGRGDSVAVLLRFSPSSRCLWFRDSLTGDPYDIRTQSPVVRTNGFLYSVDSVHLQRAHTCLPGEL